MDEIKEEVEEEKRNPLVYILALFLVLMLILWIVPYYSVKLDPEPKNIPSKESILPINITIEKRNTTFVTRNEFLSLLDPNDQLIKQTASKVASQSCNSEKVCQAKAIFYFVRDN
ncbi:MAG: hypothetical protein KKF74_00400, partial [Nanoarchaeota archaeon]|nr:hypothetical protein [Nanoarchaeota archaeon]